MYEHKSQPLASTAVFYRRIAGNTIRVLGLLSIVLLIGTFGYHCATQPFTPWIDSFHNASMILSGMGLVIVDGYTSGGKLFSSFYALFSGIIFVSSIGFILTPALHRIFHRLHLEEK